MIEYHSTVVVFVASGTEEMEAIIISDMLRRAGINVIIAGEYEIITASRGVKFLPDVTFEHILEDEEYLALIFPGGARASETFCSHPHIEKLLRTHIKRNAIVGAMCESPAIFVAYDLVPSTTAMTSHPDIQHIISKKYHYMDEKVVIDGNIITCQGAGTSFDFAFALIEILSNSKIAASVARDIQY